MTNVEIDLAKLPRALHTLAQGDRDDDLGIARNRRLTHH
jgi:hypothetical protein